MGRKVNERLMEGLHENLKSGDQHLLDCDAKAAKTLAKDFESATGEKLFFFDDDNDPGVRISLSDGTVDQLTSETQPPV